MAHPKSMKIDQEGFLLNTEGLRVHDETLGHELLTNMALQPNGKVLSRYEGQEIVLEPFDQPVVVQMVAQAGTEFLELQGPYQTHFQCSPETLTVDAWDRFHGLTLSGLPFVFSRKAQNEFFNLVEEFGDDWFHWQGKRVSTPSFYQEDSKIRQDKFWQQHYEDGTDGWELDQPAPALVQALKSLKLSKQRIAVLGSGSGEDAAYLARQGHLVTAFDFSEAALGKAKEKHRGVSGLKWVEADIFQLSAEWNSRFDLVFDHACFVAVPPSRRGELVKVWKRLLEPGGSLLGVFFLFPFRDGPPFGLTEWELQQHLGPDFQHLYWSRDVDSPPGRNELLVYSQLKRREGP